MALAAARRLSSTSTSSAAPVKLSEIFRVPKNQSPPPHLSSPFGDRKPPSRPAGSGGEQPPRRPKPREPWEGEAGALLRRLHEGRYLTGPDFSSAPHAISPDAVKAAAERFGNDNQVVAKWLSGSDLKKLALFGCPTVERRTVFASKRLRAFFNIQEDKLWKQWTSQSYSGGPRSEVEAKVQQSGISMGPHVCLICQTIFAVSALVCRTMYRETLVVDSDGKDGLEQFDDIIVQSP